ncbi:MAG: hypothetical protein ABL973_20550 [Micropepsaceae bacterium]
MTEFEMAYLMNDQLTTLATYTAGNFTTVTTFLVAGYLTAHKLSRAMIATVIGVYTIWLLGGVVTSIRLVRNVTGLAHQIALFAEQGKGLQWHVSSSAPVLDPRASVGVVVVVFAVVYLASLAFFFQCRRMNRKTETAPTVQPTAATSP